jgi:hypothetical protein
MLARSIRDSRKSDDLEASRARDEFVGYLERAGHEIGEDWSTHQTLASGLRKVRKCRGGTFASNLMIGFLTFDLSMPVTENII